MEPYPFAFNICLVSFIATFSKFAACPFFEASTLSGSLCLDAPWVVSDAPAVDVELPPCRKLGRKFCFYRSYASWCLESLTCFIRSIPTVGFIWMNWDGFHRGSGHCLSRRAAAIGARAQPQGPDFRKYARAAQWVGGVKGGWGACWNMFILLFLACWGVGV